MYCYWINSFLFRLIFFLPLQWSMQQIKPLMVVLKHQACRVLLSVQYPEQHFFPANPKFYCPPLLLTPGKNLTCFTTLASGSNLSMNLGYLQVVSGNSRVRCHRLHAWTRVDGRESDSALLGWVGSGVARRTLKSKPKLRPLALQLPHRELVNTTLS